MIHMLIRWLGMAACVAVFAVAFALLARSEVRHCQVLYDRNGNQYVVCDHDHRREQRR